MASFSEKNIHCISLTVHYHCFCVALIHNLSNLFGVSLTCHLTSTNYNRYNTRVYLVNLFFSSLSFFMPKLNEFITIQFNFTKSLGKMLNFKRCYDIVWESNLFSLFVWFCCLGLKHFPQFSKRKYSSHSQPTTGASN